MIINLDHLPLVSLPTDLSDEAAAQLLDFLYDLARELENHYAAQIHRHHHPDKTQQISLLSKPEPPF